MIKISAVLGVAAMAVVLATPASANCIPGKVFNSFQTSSVYVVFDSSATNDSITARFWQDGARANGNEGTYDDSRWLLPFGPGVFYISGDLGDADVAGCITGRMNMLLQSGSQFMFASAPEDPSQAAQYDFSNIGASELTAASVNRPRVTTSSRAGAQVNVTVVVDPPVGGSYGSTAAADTAFRVVQATGTSDPGAGAAAYTVLGTVTPGVPAPFTVDCTNTATDRWIATQLVIDGGQQNGDLVSARTRINCNPALADPDKGFKVIDRKGAKSPTRQ
jgi:hypothetical protein